MDVGILSSPSANSVLRDARLLNSDIGRHSVKCNFSTRLDGRFYQNGSLERHTLRKSRLVEMQAKKRRLEKELQLEERRVKLLEERLGDTEKAQEDAHGLIVTIGRGVVRFQAFVRRRQALRLFRAMRHESLMRNLIARFFQCHFRGWKGRLCAESRREYLIQKRRDESVTTIQASVRRCSQRNIYLDLLTERNRLNNQSAATIQATLRGKVTRRMYVEEVSRRQDAARNVQQIWRGAAVRIMVANLRQELARKRTEAERPKRIPLHLRRYSTYGSNSNGPRRPNNAVKAKRDVRMRRRSSDAMIIMKDGHLSSLLRLQSASTSGDPDENDSIGTTVTSLTNHTNATENSQNKRGSSHYRRTNNSPSWQSPHRALSSSDTALRKRCSNKVDNSRSASNNSRRASISTPLYSAQKWSRERGNRQPSLETCNDSDSNEGSTTPRERQENSNNTLESQTSLLPAREVGIKTPITVSEEASLIVQEVLGKIVMCHSIVHSGFEDEFSEHEDDLE